MKAIDHSTYNVTTPETFNWNKVDSYKLGSSAVLIKDAIQDDFETKERLLVPGLRAALNIIAKDADLQ